MITLKASQGKQLDDIALIHRILNGEKDKYEMLMRKYNQHLYRIGRSYLKNTDDVEDIIQETYIKAYIHLDSFNNKSSFSTWLTRILINEALRVIKHTNKKIEDSLKFETDDDSNNLIPKEMTTNKTPENILLNKELQSNLENIIDTLPEKYKTIYIMREIEGMELSEISLCLDTNLNTVKVRLLRARKFIKERLIDIYKAVPVFDLHESRCNMIVSNVMERLRNISI